MAQKKDKNVKVRDLAPKKDAKGGGGRIVSGNTSADGRVGLNKGTTANAPSSNRPSSGF